VEPTPHTYASSVITTAAAAKPTSEAPQTQSGHPSFEFDLGDLYDDMDEEEAEELTGLPHPLGLERAAPAQPAQSAAGKPGAGVSAMTALSSAAPSPAAPAKTHYRGTEVTDSMFADLYDSDSDAGFSDFSDEDVVSAAVATRAAAATTAKDSATKAYKK
jgi:hypothetical protein